jgi:hypothetical protein
MAYEHRTQALLPFRRFARRLLVHASFGLLVIAASLALGVLGYHHFEGFSWVDALLNASMILGGMGPVSPLLTTGGKIFASFYALFSGVAFLVFVGIMVAPLAHRLLHKLHLETGKPAARP